MFFSRTKDIFEVLKEWLSHCWPTDNFELRIPVGRPEKKMEKMGNVNRGSGGRVMILSGICSDSYKGRSFTHSVGALNSLGLDLLISFVASQSDAMQSQKISAWKIPQSHDISCVLLRFALFFFNHKGSMENSFRLGMASFHVVNCQIFSFPDFDLNSRINLFVAHKAVQLFLRMSFAASRKALLMLEISIFNAIKDNWVTREQAQVFEQYRMDSPSRDDDEYDWSNKLSQLVSLHQIDI
ncbi:hypothetical protein PROFUN_15653 [Planoprotostelium fungivorum]|uniref:Uncharacterized protein n=1 Tax=Planoprotostelium fungivorum TaxID=1890364 RepID=A0A2P6MV70_9EUKA|nr:hypothetical protein PROFUN_15653 [Planoprotostelium fungivorum]